MTTKKHTTAAPLTEIDLSSVDAAVKRQEEGILVPILNMDGKTSLGFSIRIAGPDSAKAKAAQEELADELIERGSTERLKASEIGARGVRYLAKVTLGWEPQVKLDGAVLPFSEANALKLYQRFNFIREQIDVKAGQRADFLKP